MGACNYSTMVCVRYHCPLGTQRNLRTQLRVANPGSPGIRAGRYWNSRDTGSAPKYLPTRGWFWTVGNI
jgi:hypothetical protein